MRFLSWALTKFAFGHYDFAFYFQTRADMNMLFIVWLPVFLMFICHVQVNPPVNVMPISFPGHSHSQAFNAPDDLPKTVARTLNQGSSPMSMDFHPIQQNILLGLFFCSLISFHQFLTSEVTCWFTLCIFHIKQDIDLSFTMWCISWYQCGGHCLVGSWF